MSFVKVFVPTYRRHQLLPRALHSLQQQTFKDWRCEVHNDDPDDDFPRKLVAQINDPRITVVNHAQRLGGAGTMNAFYAPVSEAFVSILEDDNWWEPPFLAQMIAAAERNPEVTVLWANMKFWRECEDGSFVFTGRTTYPEEGPPYEEFWWPDTRQIMGAVHSNGACLIRSRANGDYRIPQVPFATIEAFRERTFPQPLLLVRQPLANFSITLATERAGDGTAYGEANAFLLASFFRAADWPPHRMVEVFEVWRLKSPPSTNNFLNAALIDPSARLFLRIASVREVLRWMAGLARRPKMLMRLLQSRRVHSDWWEFLQTHTAERFEEARAREERSSGV